MAYKTFNFDQMLTSQAPRPFPGKYPTRVRVFAAGGRVPFEYVGKPSPELLALIRSSFLAKQGNTNHLNITEFDQNGMVCAMNGGNYTLRAGFADMYFVLCPIWGNLGRNARIYQLLDRVPATVAGRKLCHQQVWKGTDLDAPYMRMVEDCARGRVTRAWFSEAEITRMADRVYEESLKWLAVPAPVRRTQAPAVEQPTPPAFTQETREAIDRAMRAIRLPDPPPQFPENEPQPPTVEEGRPLQTNTDAELNFRWMTQTMTWDTTAQQMETTTIPVPPPQQVFITAEDGTRTPLRPRAFTDGLRWEPDEPF